MAHARKILVVEDNELNRAILCSIVADEYEVLEAENGQAALDILRECGESISLILLDVMMPVMDGYTFLDRIKEDPELSLIPVIVMTQSDTEEDEVAALAHGATDFVPKPYRPQVILHRAASLIKLRETAAMVNQFKYDQLTGLYSKEYFLQCVRDRLAQHPDKEYSLICANVENFKLYNDAFGVAAGDRLLREIADEFRANVGSAGAYGRYRADRFICLQERNEEYTHRIETGEDGRYCCIVPDRGIVMKWGIYEITDRSLPVEGMCDRALLAVDHIKGQYNKYYAVYDDSLREKLIREQNITAAMEPALAEEQFVVYLQPKYSLRDSCMAGAEALVRWVHPEWGFMPPGEFIPLFEKNGFIPRLDYYVWERVCALLRDWRERGLALLPISVNVSRADVYQGGLVENLVELTQRYGIDPAYLHLEITESAYAENPGRIVSTVEELRRRGFVVEMDDFGSGYSSLNMLSQMTLDILKLDMKFIQSEMAKPGEQSILNDVIAMAHRLRLSVVAEGVETREQMERLRAVDCDYVQGYFFARPMPIPEFEAMWKEQEPRPGAPRTRARRGDERLPRLLVADENAGYCQRVRQIFEREYEVLEAAGWQEALDCVRSDAGVSVVIVSMTLPEKGAEALLKAMWRDPALWEIPVLATIPNGEQAEEFSLAMDADDFLCKCHPIFDLRRRVRHLMDMAELRERERVLQNQASRDYLTGLLNRRGLQAALASLHKDELPAAVCLFDLDHLKQVNDTCGHDMGDRMIRTFAALLRRYTRGKDIRCRYGGDEFLVVLKRMDNGQAVLKKCAEICRAFGDSLPEIPFQAACSAGIAILGEEETVSDSLMIERADKALYRAKRENRGGCCLWSEDQA